MQNGQTAALEELTDFLAAMRDWEVRYYPLFRRAHDNQSEVKHISEEMREAKRSIIRRWCTPELLDRAPSTSVGDPPAFDPDRDGLKVLEESADTIVVEHTQNVGLESQHRFRLARENGRWIVCDAEILEEDSPPKWVPMIL